MNKTGIEYIDYTWNPYTGCLNWMNGVCGGGSDFKCWAKTMTERFKKNFPNGFEPTFYPKRLPAPARIQSPQRIGVCFMGDLFGDSVTRQWQDDIIDRVRRTSWHTFVFLTKCPWNLPKWNPWPDNAWVGVSWVGDDESRPLCHFEYVKARVKFISFEPLLQFPDWWTSELLYPSFNRAGVTWIIIGAATNPYRPPKIEWVEEIERAADLAGIPIFEKNNLAKLLNRPVMQEYPKAERRVSQVVRLE